MSFASVVRAPAGLHRQTRAAVPRDLLFRVRRIGYIVLALQFAGFLCWSTLLYRRFSLTPDFAQYHQAWYLIAHGNLDPRDTLGRFPFWQNHAEFMLWPMSLLYWVWPHCVDLLWLQIQPANYRRLVAERGWSHQAFEHWHTAAMADTLLEPPSA